MTNKDKDGQTLLDVCPSLGSTSRIKEVRSVDSDHFFKELKNLSIASGELASNVTSCA